MTEATGATRGWPADVIHVNEDGWVLINRGRTADVIPGMRLLVVGSGIRELRDLFAPGAAEGDAEPPVLTLRRTYEMLEVVYVEDECAVAVAERAPVARRPQFYRGPSGELLVWVPLPDNYSWPPVEDNEDTEDTEDNPQEEADGDQDVEDEAVDASAGDAVDADDNPPAANAGDEDEPPGTHGQEDERWEEALPLNSVSVGDIVVPAVPATPSGDRSQPPFAAAGGTIRSTYGTVTPSHPGWDQHYDWMGPKPESGS